MKNILFDELVDNYYRLLVANIDINIKNYLQLFQSEFFTMEFTSVSDLHKISAIAKQKRDEEIIAKQEQHNKYFSECLVKLSKKYAPLIKEGLLRAADKGNSDAYLNFSRADFQLAIDKPAIVCSEMIKMIITEDKSFEGLKFDVWNNAAFTTHFSW